MNTCPSCGHAWTPTPKARTPKPASGAVDLSTLTRDQLYAHFKKTAPVEDVKFWLAHTRMSPGLRAGFEALQVCAETLPINRADFYRQLRQLQDLWRRERAAEVLAEHRARDTYDHKFSRWAEPEVEATDDEAIEAIA